MGIEEFIVYKDVIFMDNKYMYKFPLILNKLRSIAPDCGSVYNICGIYPTCPLSYTVMKFVTTSGLNFNNLDNFSSNLMGYLVAVVNNDIKLTEIYDVCTSKDFRRKGVAKSLLEAITVNTIYSQMWLGIMLDNPLWDSIIKLYITYGFRNPVISILTPSGMNIGMGVLALTYYKPDVPGLDLIPSIPKDIIRDSNKLRERYQEATLNCITKIALSFELANYLKQFLYKDKEYGGEMFISHYEGEYAILTLNPNSIIEGSPAPNYVVQLPFTTMTFHTHPEICYIHHNCYIGWPSGQDMGYVVSGYLANPNPLYIHFVITEEGIYSIYLTEDFQRILKLLGEFCISGIITHIIEKFRLVEYQRTTYTNLDLQKVLYETQDPSYLFVENDKRIDTKKKYLQLVNDYSFRDLKRDTISSDPTQEEGFNICSNIIEDNFNLFVVNLISWDQITQKADKYTIGEFKYLGKCPISTGETSNNQIVIDEDPTD